MLFTVYGKLYTVYCRDFLKANSFAHSECSNQYFCAKTSKHVKLDKLCQMVTKDIKSTAVIFLLSVLHSLAKLLLRFSEFFCNRVIALLQYYCILLYTVYCKLYTVNCIL